MVQTVPKGNVEELHSLGRGFPFNGPSSPLTYFGSTT